MKTNVWVLIDKADNSVMCICTPCGIVPFCSPYSEVKYIICGPFDSLENAVQFYCWSA